MNTPKFSKISIIKLSSLPVFFLVHGFKSDFSNYLKYYNNSYFNNFYNYSFEPGFSLLLAISNELKIPFELFWIVCNGFTIFVMFSFLIPKPTYKSLSVYIFFAFLISNILSANLFSNLIRNSLSVGITFLLINKKAKWYFYFIPPFFHIASIFLIISHWIVNLFSKMKINFVILITLLTYLFGPLIGLVLKENIIQVLEVLDIRTIVNNLNSEYKPAYRYLSIIIYSSLSYYLYLIYYCYKKNGFSYFDKINYFGLSIKNMYTFCIWTIICYPLYLSLLGFGQFARLLTYQIWIGEFLLIYLFIININYIFKSKL